jgi:H+-transporting ATPase
MTKPTADKPKPKDDKDSLKTLAMPELMKKLGASADGLTQAEAVKRQAQYGPNAIEEKKTNEYLKFLSYFWGPIPWMIEAAVILSGVVQHWMDFFVILALLLSNALVGFWEEHQAGNAIAALKARLAVLAKVKRDGKWVNPKASELVPGDVIRLRLGDIVPADARLLDGDSIEVDQSALTGESLPVTAKSGGAVYSGSIIRQGEIDAIVYATGTNTYFGKTAQLVQEAHTVSHFQKAVMKIGDYLIILDSCLRPLPRRQSPHHTRILPGASGGGHPRRHAYCPVGDHGSRSTPARQEGSDRNPPFGHRGTGWCRRSVLRQNRHPHAKQTHIGRSLLH